MARFEKATRTLILMPVYNPPPLCMTGPVKDRQLLGYASLDALLLDCTFRPARIPFFILSASSNKSETPVVVVRVKVVDI